MRSNKAETAVQWFRMSLADFAGIFGHGNLIYNIIPKLKKETVFQFIIFSVVSKVLANGYKNEVFLSNPDNLWTYLFDQ